MPTFITTLALFTVLRGFANLITGGFPLTDLPDWFGFLGAGYFFGVPFPVYIFLVVFALMHGLRCRSRASVAPSMRSAAISKRHACPASTSSESKTATLVITGVLTAISGTLIASQIGSGIGTTATGMELDVIAATIIGGTSLFGGRGMVWGTLLGVLLLGCITNGMTLLNVSEYWQYVVRGAIILGAVLFNYVLEKLR